MSEVVSRVLVQASGFRYIEEWHTEPPPLGSSYIVTADEWDDSQGDILIRKIFSLEKVWLLGQPRLVVVPDVILPDGTVRRGQPGT